MSNITLKETLAKVIKTEEVNGSGKKSTKILVSNTHKIVYKKIEPFSL